MSHDGKKFSGEFIIQDYANLPDQYDTSGGVETPPISLTVKGPPSLRRQADVAGSKPYVVSNGGPALDLVEATE